MPDLTTNEDNPYLKRAYALQDAKSARTLYDEWATKYDSDLSSLEYTFPQQASTALLAQFPDADLANIKILDAGCGTGLVGISLKQAGAHRANIMGCDISTGMLEVARKSGAYGSLDETDLSKPLRYVDGQFDGVVCVGTLTQGHVGPDPVLGEFARVVKKGSGVVVATVLEAIWESGGFRSRIEELVKAGLVEVVSDTVVGITKGESEGGRLVVLRKL